MEIMGEFLHAFGSGFAFAIGVLCGALLSRLTGRVTPNQLTEIREQNVRIEGRLDTQLVHIARIADAAEEMVGRD